MKKYSLSARSIALILICMAAVILNVVVLMLTISQPHNAEQWVITLVIADVTFLCIMIYVVYYLLVRPVMLIQRMYQRFLDGQAYEELFDIQYEVITGWSKVMKQFRHLLNKQDAIRMSQKQAEYLALQNQINPHFLYNTLEAIRGDAICAGIDSIAETTEALSIFFRYAITGVDHLVTLEEEIDNVENYFTIQRYRFEEKLKLEILYPDGEEVLSFKLPKLTIQPFVENAIFHGLEKKAKGGTVKIKIETTQRNLMITVMDDGVGMNESEVDAINNYFERVAVSYVGEDKKKRGGIAIKNVNSRIKLLFGEEYGVHLYSAKGIGTDVVIILPKIQRGDYEERIVEN